MNDEETVRPITPESPQTDEQAQVRADTHTGAVIDALAAEIDRLRTALNTQEGSR